MTVSINPTVTIFLLADFTADSLAALLENDPQFPPISVEQAPYDQVEPTLLSMINGTETDRENVIVWTRAEAVSAFFAQLLGGDQVETDSILGEVDKFADLIIKAAGHCQSLFIPLWILPSHLRGLGLMDFKRDQGVSASLLEMNNRLVGRISRTGNIYPLNSPRWIQKVGERSFSPKQWYLGKVAFSNEVFKEAILDIKAGLSALNGQSRKLLVVDLDDTLWGGVVGEVGWEGITLGGHDALGEAYIDFQRALKGLKKRGVLLAIASKNDESVALEALSKHPEMVLRPNDFVAMRIDWNDKAQNIADLVTELNLGLQSTVFIDENPFERGRVRESLSEVLVPDWPENPMLYVKALEELRCFDTTDLTEEDIKRHSMYLSERWREDTKVLKLSHDEWLETLQLIIIIEPLKANQMKRIVQLINKTNQMNLRTRRMTAEELNEWCSVGNRHFWTFRVSDKFGDSGLTALLSLENRGDIAEIIDFVVSCRVFKRGVEETILAKAVVLCRSLGVRQVFSEYLPTKKNAPCLAFWKASGFDCQADNRTFVFDTSKPYMFPGHIEVAEID